MPVTKVAALRRHSSQALYIQLARYVEREILSGHYEAFARLPSEQELVAKFGVSRVTVRQAVRLLVERGLVEVKQGKGIFVIGPVVHHGLDNLTGFYDLLLAQGYQPKTRLLSFGKATPGERRGTALEGVEAAMALKRLYLLRGKPFALMQSILAPIAGQVTKGQAGHHTVYGILRDLLGVQVARAEIGIRARGAPIFVGSLLRLRKGQHALVMERMSTSAQGQVVEHSFFYIVPETYEFRLNVHGPLQITSAIKQFQPLAGRSELGETPHVRQTILTAARGGNAASSPGKPVVRATLAGDLQPRSGARRNRSRNTIHETAIVDTPSRR